MIKVKAINTAEQDDIIVYKTEDGKTKYGLLYIVYSNEIKIFDFSSKSIIILRNKNFEKANIEKFKKAFPVFSKKVIFIKKIMIDYVDGSKKVLSKPVISMFNSKPLLDILSEKEVNKETIKKIIKKYNLVKNYEIYLA